ncbi:MAG: hypothetical protein QE493_05270 [Verrucomicrobiae bacterium]|nr:hypothetical protein [Verrucomicrobiae bacterium]
MTLIMAEIAGLMNQEAGETAAQTNAMMYSANAGVVQANDQATDIRDAGNADYNAAVDAMITGIVLSAAVICVGGYATYHSDPASDPAAAPKAAAPKAGGTKPDFTVRQTEVEPNTDSNMRETEENTTTNPNYGQRDTHDATYSTTAPSDPGSGPGPETVSDTNATENNTGLNSSNDNASVTKEGAANTRNNPASNKAPSTLAKTGRGILSLMKSPMGIQTVMGSLNSCIQLQTGMITAAGQRTAAADNAAAASAQGLASYFQTATSNCETNLNWIANNLSTLQQDEAGIGNDMSSMVSASRPG